MADDATPDKRMAGARRRLVHLHGLDARTEAAERQILAAAEHRHAEVLNAIAKLAPRAAADRAAGDRYTAAVLERGRLETVIARAKANLGEP